MGNSIKDITPLVSIIVPIYNVEQYVNRCVDSILAQTYGNIEVILVDDGSTDKSRERISVYNNDSRCKVIYKDNGGASSARNVGINLAKGEYIYFIDADDYIDSVAVETLLRLILKENADFCCYRFYIDDGDSVRVGGKNYTTTELHNRSDIIIDAFVGKNIKVSPVLKFFSSYFIKNNGIRFYEGVIYEDYLFTLICAMHANKVVFLDKALYYVYERSNSVSRSVNPNCVVSFLTIDTAMREAMRTANIYDTYVDIYEASLKKQILHVLFMAAYRVNSYNDFVIIFNNAEKCGYLSYNGLGKMHLMGIKICALYKLSKHPRLFYNIIKFLALLRILKL